MRGWGRAAGCALVAALGCARAEPLVLGGPDDARVLMALLSEAGAVERLEVLERGAPPSFAARLDRPFPLVTFALAPADFITADGEPVSAEALAEVGARLAFEDAARQVDLGACGRCLEPPAGGLQVVHSGDACPPLLTRGQVFRAVEGRLEPVPADRVDADAQRVLVAAQQSLRLEWPGACAFPEPEPAAGELPRWSPVAPEAAPWPARALAQAPDGTVGVFTDGRHLAVLADGRRVEGDGLPFAGRPRAAVAMPPGGPNPRFLVATDRAHEGAPERGALRWAEVQGGLLTSRPAALAGLADPEGLEVHGARWVDTDAGPRLLLLGGRGGRGAVVVCAADGPELSCAESSLSDGTCADIGPVSSLVPTPRGWLASGPGAFAAAEVSGGAPVGWRCEGPGRPQVTLRRDELPTAVDVRLRAVGRLGGRVFGCAEVEGTGDRVVLFQAPLGPATPFTGAALGWVPIAGAYEGRCGEFSRLPTELAAASPTALLANLMISAVELDETGRAVERGWSSYTGDLGPDPITGALQRAEGWTLFLTGWAVEPRALGAAIVTRGADAPWRAVYGVRDSTAYATLAARDRDFVAYNAFTDGLPLRVTPRPDASAPSGLGAALEVVSQDPASRLMLGGREAVDDSIYVPERGEIWLLGNDHVRPTGGVEDFDDRVWRPFLRRLGPGLERAVDVALPLERGAFLCDAAPLAPGKYLLVGGQGTLLIYDGEVLEPVEVDYDDPDTEAVEVAPFDLNTGESSPDFLAVDAAGGVAWAVGFDALIVRVARERRGGVVRWVGRRISQERVAPGDLRSPIIPRSRFTHVRALAPDRAVLVAQRRPMFVNLGCTAVRRTRNLGDPSDLLQIGPSAGWRQVEAAVSPGAAAPWALGLSSWWPFPALDGPLPEIVPHGLVGPPGGLTVVFWEGRLWREDGAEARTPFYPSAAAYHPDLGWALAGANARVAVGR